MRQLCKATLLTILATLVATPASAQIGIFSRVKFGTAFLDAVSDCTTLTNIGVCIDTDNGSLWIKQSGVWTQVTPGAPTTATYITQTANGTLSAEQFLGGLATGMLKNTTTTGVLSIGSAGTDYVAPGAVTTSGLTQATARILGRTTASTGAIEELASVPFSLGGLGLTSAADDTVPVSSGSAYVATAVPACSNATTSKLLYNTSTNAFSCGTDQDGGAAVSNYQTVQDEGSDLPQQPKLNFIGSGVSCVDGSSKTDCTISGGGGGAPTGATYITQTADGTLSAEQALSALSTGVVKVTTTTGVLSTATEGTDYYKPGGTDVAFADGGTGLSSASDDTTLISNGSAWQAKAVPDCTDTGGNHLNYTASSNTLSCGTSSSGGGGGGMTLLEQHTASASASLDFTTAITSTYDDYLIELVGIVPGTSETELNFRVSTNGGSSYSATGYQFVGIANSTSDIGISSSGLVSTSFAEIRLMTLTDATQSYGVNGSVRFRNPGSASLNKSVEFQLSAALKSGATLRLYTTSGSGFWGTTTAVDAFRFFFSSGNIASGTIRVYGLEK